MNTSDFPSHGSFSSDRDRRDRSLELLSQYGEPPNSFEAEQSVLGSLIIEPDKFDVVAPMLTTEDFYYEQHRVIYDAIRDMFMRDRSIDAVTLAASLTSLGLYDDAGGKSYIKALIDFVPTTANVLDYARIVRDRSKLRQLIDAGEQIIQMARVQPDDVGITLDRAEQLVFALSHGHDVREFHHIRDIIVGVYENLTQLIQNKDEAQGIPSGYAELDRLLVGFGKSDLILIGSRPGMGKTTYAMNIAVNAAAKRKVAVAVFQLEMSREQLGIRMLSSEAMIDSYKFRTGMFTGEEWDNLARAAAMISELEIYIDDSTGITVTAMKSKLRRIKNLGLVIIDYLQLMQADRRIDNRVQEVADISRNLKIMAKELQVPIITCAQLSRGPESRTDKRPMLSDLRDSGAIEQDADVVMFLYRDEYYKNDKDRENVAELIVAKNRHGATGTVEMGFLGKFSKFTTLERNRADGELPVHQKRDRALPGAREE